jgi:Leucine Rich repeat
VGARQFVPLDDTQTEDTAGGGGGKEETPSSVATVSGKAVARAATGTTSSAAPLARPSEEWPMWPTWEPPSSRASLPEPSGALRRLVPKLEDCARRMVVSNRPQSARDLVPGVVCADTDTAASAFWDCEDLVWWVTSKWSVPDDMQAYCRRPDVTRLTRLVLLVRGGDHALAFRHVPRPASIWMRSLSLEDEALLREALNADQCDALAQVEDLFLDLVPPPLVQVVADAMLRAGPMPQLRRLKLCCAHGLVPILSVLRTPDQLRGLQKLSVTSFRAIEEIHALAEALRVLPRLRELEVSGLSAIRDVGGGRCFWEALGNPFSLRQLRKLTIASSALREEDLEAFKEATATPGALASLEHLDFTNFGLGALHWVREGIMPGSLPSLKELIVLSNRAWYPRDVAKCKPIALPALQLLRVKDNSRVADDLSTVPAARKLDMSGTPLDADCMRALSVAISRADVDATLEELVLSYCSIPTEGMRWLSDAMRAPGALASLRSLELKDGSCSEGGVRHLCEAIATQGALRGLEHLAVTRTKCSADGARWLAESIAPGALPALTSLDLSCASLDAEGMRWLSEALRRPGTLPHLQVLQLTGNGFGCRGMRWLSALIAAHGTLRSLRSLRLNGCSIGTNGVRWLSEALRALGAVPMLQTLDLSGNDLGLEGAWSISEALRVATVLPNLRSLYLSSAGFDAECMEFLGDAIGAPGALAKLEELSLADNVLKEGIVALCRGFEAFGALPSLRIMDLSYAVRDEDVRHVADVIRRPGVLPSLRGMYFFHYDSPSDEFVQPLLRARPTVSFSK